MMKFNLFNSFAFFRTKYEQSAGVCRNYRINYSFLISSIFLFLISFNSSYAQPEFEWAKSMGGHRTDKGNAIAVDSWGNVYTAGQFFDTADFNPSGNPKEVISKGGWDIFLSKMDASGNLIWLKTIGGSGMDVGKGIVVDDTGNVYMTGLYSKTVEFNPGGPSMSLTSQGFFDVFISKFDSSGTIKWVKGVGGKKVNEANSIALDPSGNIYAVGSFEDEGDFNPGTGVNTLKSNGSKDIFIIKLDNAGNYIWSKGIGGPKEEIAFSVGVAASGNVYITGHFNDTVDFSSGLKTHILSTPLNAKQDIFIAKLNALGNMIWTKTIGGTGYENSFSLALDKSENVFITGSFAGTMDVNPDPLIIENLNSALKSTDLFILKLDSAGKYNWAKSIGSNGVETAKSVHCDVKGNVYITGSFNTTVDFDPGQGTDSFTSGGGMDVLAIKLDNDGNYLWGKQIKSPGKFEEGYAITTDAHSNVYITGYYQDTADFNPGLNSSLISSKGNEDVFVMKFSECTSVDQSISLVGPDSICPGSTYIYTVIPVHGAVSYSWTIPQGASGTSSSGSIEITFGKEGGAISVLVNGMCDTSNIQSITAELIIPHVFITINGAVLGTTNSTSYSTWQWYLNDGIINGATDSTYTVTENGDYFVIVTGSGCSDTSDAYTVNSVSGLSDIFLKEQVSVYPNPANGIVHIKSPIIVDIVISSIEGRIIRNIKSASSIPVDDFNSGFYILRILDEKGNLIKVEKLLIQK